MNWKPNNPELLDFKLVELGNIKALATIKVNGFIIKNIKVIQQGKQRPYIRLPETSFIKDGEVIYTHSFVLDDTQLKNRINNLLLLRYFKDLLIKKSKRSNNYEKERKKQS